MKTRFVRSVCAVLLVCGLLTGCKGDDNSEVVNDVSQVEVVDGNEIKEVQKIQETQDTQDTQETYILDPLEEKTLASFTKHADDVYFMDYYSNYKIEDYLASDIVDVLSMDTWMTTQLTHGIPTGDIKDIECSSFSIKDYEDNHLFGRNYDTYNGDVLVLRTNSENGYATIGIVDMSHINLGARGKYSVEDSDGKMLLLAAPWCICDGMNEKGLGVSILELPDKHEVTDTDKGDLLVYTTTRVILDKCATVDEAVELLNDYDIYSPKSNSFHLYITDKTGKNVVVEWANNRIYVIEDNVVTNFQLCKDAEELKPDLRYINLHNALDETEHISAEEAMGLLKSAGVFKTMWSAVYNLDQFSVELSVNFDYTRKYNFTGNDRITDNE